MRIRLQTLVFTSGAAAYLVFSALRKNGGYEELYYAPAKFRLLNI